MTSLLVGFDSAWTPSNSGALVGVLRVADGTFEELALPAVANFAEAESQILAWQAQVKPAETLVLLDQPTIVHNATGQRPVENIVASCVSRRFGGVQPANTGREEMFGPDAPVWRFLNRFGGPADPFGAAASTQVFETYPVLVLIALGWTLPDPRRPAGRLPKYNPARRKTFASSDWSFICLRVSEVLASYGMPSLAGWLEQASAAGSPSKADQDRLDACICLAVAVHMASSMDCLVVGEVASGYMVVPHGAGLENELRARAEATGRDPSQWVRRTRLRA